MRYNLLVLDMNGAADETRTITSYLSLMISAVSLSRRLVESLILSPSLAKPLIFLQALLEATAGSRKFQNIIRFCECLVSSNMPEDGGRLRKVWI